MKTETEREFGNPDYWMKKWSCVPESTVRRVATTLVPGKSWSNQRKFDIVKDFLSCGEGVEGQINDCRFRVMMIEITSYHKEAKYRLDQAINRLLAGEKTGD
jgi:hypothetical protein